MKTLVTTCLSLLLLQLLHKSSAQHQSEVDEIAPYTIASSAQGYEQRVYEAAKWVCHDTEGSEYSYRNRRSSFSALFMYITGSNNANMDIPMTAPVTMLYQQTQQGSNRHQMCFYLPDAQQASPPLPLNDQVYFEDRPRLTVFSRRFGGYLMFDFQWQNQATELQRLLQAAQETNVDYSSFYRAGYDSPMKFWNRRNEVWFVKTA